MRSYFTRACVPHKCLCMRMRSGLTSLEIFSRLAFVSLRCWLLRSNGSIHDAGAKLSGSLHRRCDWSAGKRLPAVSWLLVIPRNFRQ